MVIITIVYIPSLVSRSVKIKTVNPATEEILAEYDALTEEQVNHEVNDSRKVYESIWKKFDISERAKLLRNLGHMLQQRKKEYATIITNEMGKPITESLAEVEKCSWVCEYYADNGGKFLEPEFIETNAKDSYVRFDPLGVIGCIMPWNFPFWQVLRFCVPALFAGNTVLLKHSRGIRRSWISKRSISTPSRELRCWGSTCKSKC